MNKVSLGAAAEQTRAFMRRESSLVLPVAFATFGIAAIALALVTPERGPQGQIQPGLWSLAVFPLLFLSLTGQLAICYLVLRPGASVRDALGAAMSRLPLLLALILLLFLAIGLMLVAVSIVMAVVAVAGNIPPEAIAGPTAFVLGLLALLLGARLLMVGPLIADRRSGVVATLKEGWALSRGRVWRFVTLLLVFLLLYLALAGAVQLGIGSVLMILGKIAGAEGAAGFLTVILSALAGAVINAFWAVLLANIYRQLTPPAEETRPS